MSAALSALADVAGAVAQSAKVCIGCGAKGFTTKKDRRIVRCIDCAAEHKRETTRVRVAANRLETKRKQNVQLRANLEAAPPPFVVVAPMRGSVAARSQVEMERVLQLVLDHRLDKGAGKLQGNYVEMYLPFGYARQSRSYDLYHELVTPVVGKKYLARHAPSPTFALVCREALESMRLEGERYFGSTPFVLHDLGALVARWGKDSHDAHTKSEGGQPIHTDVDSPELIFLYHVMRGVATCVAHYTQAEASVRLAAFEETIGHSLGEMLMGDGNVAMSHLLSTMAASFLLTDGDLTSRMGPAVAGVLEPATLTRLVGSWPHFGPPVNEEDDTRFVIFGTATQLRMASVYNGFEQKIVGECEIFWAFAAKTEEQREWWKEKAKEVMVAHKDMYKNCRVSAQNCPVAKVATLMNTEGTIPLDMQERAYGVLEELRTWVVREKQLKSLKWQAAPINETLSTLKFLIDGAKQQALSRGPK